MPVPITDYERGFSDGHKVGLSDQRAALAERGRMIQELLTEAYAQGHADGGDHAHRGEATTISPVEYLPAAIPAATPCQRCGGEPGAHRVQLLLTQPSGRYRGWVHAGDYPTTTTEDTHAK